MKDINLGSDVAVNKASKIKGDALDLISYDHGWGSAWYKTEIDLLSNWSTTFNISAKGGSGTSDGYAFVVNGDSLGLEAIGDGGQNLGFFGWGSKKGVANSYAVTFDMWYTGPVDWIGFAQSSNDIIQNGLKSPISLDNNTYTVGIEYDAYTTTLSAYTGGIFFNQKIDLAQVAGSSAYLGFTAANGGGTMDMVVNSWSIDTQNNGTLIWGNSLYKTLIGEGWEQIANQAKEMNGYLVNISSSEENSLVADIAKKQSGYGVWIGLTDKQQEGVWKNNEGEQQYFNWNTGETNGGSIENYGMMHTGNYPGTSNYIGKWNDQNPTNAINKGIIEIPIASSISFSADTVVEGETIGSTINLTAGSSSSGNLANGLTIYWKIVGIDNADLSNGDLQGSGVIKDGKLTLSHTLAKDDVIENESIALSVYSDKDFKYKIGDTATIAIEDTSVQVPASKQPTPVEKQKTYSISPSLKVLQEGGFLVTTVETSGLSKGTELYWQLSGDGVTASEFSYGSLSGSGSINGDGEFTFAHSLKSDGIQEGDELLNIKLFSDSTFTNQVGSTAYVILEDAASQASTTTQPIFKPKEESSTSNSGNSNDQGTSSSQDLFSFFADQIGSKSTDSSLLQELEVSINWKDIDFNQVTTEKKKNFSWKYVDLGEAGSNTSLSTTDLFQVKAATGDLTSTYSSTDWSKVQLGEFSSETYSATDWSLVKFGDVTTESKKTMDWSKVSDGFMTNESKTTTDDFQWSINNDTAASGKLSKKTKWNKVNIGEFSSETYSAMDWSQVNIGKFQKFGSSSIDWSEVQFGEFQKKQYKQTNWSQVNLGDFTAEDYSEINWGQVAFKGAKSVNYSALDWSQVDFGDFKTSSFKKVDWSKVQTADLTTEQYSDINWSKVKFKGSKAPTLSDLDLSLVIGSSSFSKKNAKQIDWSTVSTDDLSSSALSKLSGMGVKKKGTNVADLLKPGSQSKELSFAGAGQAKGGALTTGQESSGSGAEALLAAVEKEPVLI